MVGTFLVACPKCAKGYKMPADKVGHQVKCKCGHSWKVEAPAGPAGASPVAAEAVKPQPIKPEAVKPEAVKPEAVKPQAVKPEPVKAEPARNGAAKAKAPASGRAAVSEAVPSAAEEEARKHVGQELGNFKIEDLLGIGGFGAVYRAFDKSLHRHVALKVLPASMARAGKEKIQRFLLEARSAAKLSHPNIVTVHQICQAEDTYFIVMELVEGRSLADMVKSRRLSPQDATRIITEAARGLAHAHKRGLIHRDIKPGNIMVTEDGQVKMTDFGLARDIFRHSPQEEEGRAVGTPLYMSPEQCEGEEGDSRSDVYSLGATYYVALTRRPPYEGPSTEEVMDHHRFDPPPDPRKFLPALPAAVFRIIEKAMAKDPSERYQTAEDMLQALDGLDFAALDPNASLNLDAVSAQISAITPPGGSHVNAVIKEAVRRADKSANATPVIQDVANKANPVRWYILIAVIVALVCVAAVMVAIVLNMGQNNDGPASLPYNGGDGTAARSGSAKQPGQTGGQPTGSAVGGTGRPAAAAGNGAGSAAAKTAAGPAGSGEAATGEGEDGVASTAPAKSFQEELEENAKIKYQQAVDYEKSAWTTNPIGVIEAYEQVQATYPESPYAKKAQADLERLRSGTPDASATTADAAKTEEPPAETAKPAATAEPAPAKTAEPAMTAEPAKTAAPAKTSEPAKTATSAKSSEKKPPAKTDAKTPAKTDAKTPAKTGTAQPKP